MCTKLFVETISTKEKELFDKYCLLKNVKTPDKELIEEFLFFRLWHRRPIVKKFSIKTLSDLFETYFSDKEFIKNELTRLSLINTELDRFLNNPVIKCSPIIIDFGRYKKYNLKKSAVITEQGYYQVMEIFSGYCVVLKKVGSGRFIRINLDKNIIQLIRNGDIINLMASQNLFLGWTLINVYGYYPDTAIKFIT